MHGNSPIGLSDEGLKIWDEIKGPALLEKYQDRLAREVFDVRPSTNTKFDLQEACFSSLPNVLT